jgi:type I restriction enzyme M protein
MDAESALRGAGIDGKEVKAALKAIATTDPTADPIQSKKTTFEPDADLRDNENIPLPGDFIMLKEEQRAKLIEKLAEEHLNEEIKPYVPDAWLDHSKTKIGYEIPFTRQFYTYTRPRPVTEIRGEIESLEQQIQDLIRDLR